MELEIIEIEENDESLQAYYPYTNMKILEPFSMMCAPMRGNRFNEIIYIYLKKKKKKKKKKKIYIYIYIYI